MTHLRHSHFDLDIVIICMPKDKVQTNLILVICFRLKCKSLKALLMCHVTCPLVTTLCISISVICRFGTNVMFCCQKWKRALFWWFLSFCVLQKWPSKDFQEVHMSFFQLCKELSLRVLKVVALSLNLQPDVILSAHKFIGSMITDVPISIEATCA